MKKIIVKCALVALFWNALYIGFLKLWFGGVGSTDLTIMIICMNVTCMSASVLIHLLFSSAFGKRLAAAGYGTLQTGMFLCVCVYIVLGSFMFWDLYVYNSAIYSYDDSIQGLDLLTKNSDKFVQRLSSYLFVGGLTFSSLYCLIKNRTTSQSLA